MIILKELIKIYEKIVPLSYQLPFDNNGLKIGNENKEIKNILTCLELTEEVVMEAICKNIDLIFCHHDPMFKGITALTYHNPHTKLLHTLIKNDVAVYVSHTNIDAVPGGLNDYIYELLGGTKAKVMDNKYSIGRFGALATKMSLAKYIEEFIIPQAPNFRLTTADVTKIIKTIAVVNGSGADYYDAAVSQGVDLFITGDVDYHTAMTANEWKIPIIDIGHEFEQVVAVYFATILNKISETRNNCLNVIPTEHIINPWYVKKI